ncbi:hypothetical protein BST97_11800 [Nonlabens spongiae]|uniref:Gliding motility protein RemB n=1 Tax=Nonlabens spongiae TaxID=331648 RepID=A0A1W6MM79_9FLAO|nr:hypothetical protein [Nonlabens spongiae]ARN78616.1 hypothetical protein BST97_11800 [Nonlabens spongiae]
MKKLLFCFALIFSLGLYAQDDNERYPVFPDCENLARLDLENCFYQNLYSELYANYESPEGVVAGNSEVVVRFEVDQEGKFVPIRIDGATAAYKQAVQDAFEKLPQIKPATYNADPIFMPFILRVQVPLKENGRFTDVRYKSQAQESEYEEMREDSIAFAKAANNYNNILSNQYDGQELRSEALIPLSYQRYHRYEAGMNKIGNNAHTAVKPYTYKYVSQYFDLEAERESLLKDKTTWLGKKWHNEHFFEVAGKDYWFVLDPGVDLQVGRDNDQDITTYNNTRLVYLNGGIGKQITFGATIQESQARFPGYFEGEVRLRRTPTGTPGVVPGRGIAEDGGENVFDYPVTTGYVNFKPSKYFDLQLGHGQNFIGDGYRSLVLSDNSQPYPYFKLNAKFWKLDYTVLYTSLQDVNTEETSTRSWLQKYMVHHYLSYNVTERLNIGVFESVLWRRDDKRGFDLNYVNPLIFYQTIELQTNSRGGNAMLGATAKYKFTDEITGYGQLVFDELRTSSVLSGDGNYRNKNAFQLGVKWQNALGIDNLMLQGEFNRVRPYTYSHNTIVLNYGNTNQALAHPWGANFNELIFIGRYVKDRWYGIAKAIYGNRGYDRLTAGDTAYYGGNIYRSEFDRISDNGNTVAQGNKTDYLFGQLEAGYVINPASRLKVFGQLIYRSTSPEIDNVRVVDESTLWLNVGIRTDIMNWSFDR